MSYRVGDRVAWRITPSSNWTPSLVLGVMTYAETDDVVLLGDGERYLGAPINVCHVRRMPGEDIETATRFRERYLRLYPGTLKP